MCMHACVWACVCVCIYTYIYIYYMLYPLSLASCTVVMSCLILPTHTTVLKYCIPSKTTSCKNTELVLP